MINKIGIMQGRLTDYKINLLNPYPKFPFEEIKLAKESKFSYIEFFSEENLNKKNLIWSDVKLKRLSLRLKLAKLKKVSFIDNHSIKKNFSKNLDYYYLLINQLSKIKIKLFILTLLGRSELKKRKIENYIKSLNDLSNYCSKKKISFAVETDINFKFYREIKKKLPKNFGLVFDTGNRFNKNRNFLTDILKFRNDIKHVHIKSRNKKGENVSLYEGLVNFKKFFKFIKMIKYDGYFTLETSREKNSIKSAKLNLEHLKKCM